MMRFTVESWSPEYGSPFQAAEGVPTEAKIDAGVEIPAEKWRPLEPIGSRATDVIFVDGVRRTEARIWVETEEGLRAGLCASYAAGLVRCTGDRATVDHVAIQRTAFAPPGFQDVPTPAGKFVAHPVVSDEWTALNGHLQAELGKLEIAVAARAQSASLLILDGPLTGREHIPGAVGYIKSHRVDYLGSEQAKVIAALQPGQRSPVFLVEADWSRYSWYLRLPGGRGHSWAGIVRCEIDAATKDYERIAELTAATLPRFASEQFKDPRAPQNLYPVAGLERHLRHNLGDPQIIYRSLTLAAPR